MIGKGWTSADLDAMTEEEFSFWYAEAMALEEAKAKAIRDANNK